MALKTDRGQFEDRDTVWRRFTATLTKIMSLGMTKHSRQGRERRAAGEMQQRVRLQQWVKIRFGVFSQLIWRIEDLLPLNQR